MRLAGQTHIDRLELPGCAEQQPGRVAAAVLVEGDLTAQAFHLRGLACVHRSGLGRDQQPQRRIQLTSPAFGPGCGQQPVRPAHRVGGQQRGPFQERARRGQPPAALRSPGGTLQLRSDVLIRTWRGLRPVPGPAIRISRRIGGLRQRRMYLLDLPQ